jgi:ureidoglycolate hydrolase
MVILHTQRLTGEHWTPFGWLPVADTDAADGKQTLHFAWGDPHLNVISHAYDEIDHRPEGAVVARMYRHATHTQALMGLNVPSILAVAPADATFSSPADLAAITAFRLEPLEVLVLHRGTWHWGPFPLGQEPVQLLNVQGLRYAEDNDSVDIVAVGDVVVAG